MAQETEKKLNEVLEKAARLASGYQSLKKEVNMLRKLNQDLSLQVQELNNQLKIAKLAHDSGQESKIDKQEIKTLIDSYIKEIDDCLRLMEGGEDENGR